MDTKTKFNNALNTQGNDQIKLYLECANEGLEEGFINLLELADNSNYIKQVKDIYEKNFQNTENPNLLLNLGIYFYDKEPKISANCLNKIIEKNPIANYYLGLINLENNNIDQSIKYFMNFLSSSNPKPDTDTINHIMYSILKKFDKNPDNLKKFYSFFENVIGDKQNLAAFAYQITEKFPQESIKIYSQSLDPSTKSIIESNIRYIQSKHPNDILNWCQPYSNIIQIINPNTKSGGNGGGKGVKGGKRF